MHFEYLKGSQEQKKKIKLYKTEAGNLAQQQPKMFPLASLVKAKQNFPVFSEKDSSQLAKMPDI